ncbi:Unknown protein [Striga hermonthica]|uniref:NB-ARC domain-containing protein n=1 Tax=Striga hermonthica TaxID=68872 RepID=A0A9N7RRL6_STRHE|nr:Unknown protein [Striga hermonthica]
MRTIWINDKSEKGEVVGQEKYLELLKGMLLSRDPKRRVIVVVGMAGIGKTTLAKCICRDPDIVARFTIFDRWGREHGLDGWATVKTYRGDIFQCLLPFHRPFLNTGDQSYNEVMRGHLRSHLSGTRYLIVLDDMGDLTDWNQLKGALPDEGNGSRILVTTQNADLVGALRASPHHVLRDPFLDEDASWQLLRRAVFGASCHEHDCPYELERAGRMIASGCEGLPLAILHVGKLLRGEERTAERWRALEESDSLFDNKGLSAALSPSYRSLPTHLKHCFLYMGLIPKGTGIRTAKLFQAWIAEGFVEKRRSSSRSLEATADGYLNELVAKSLVLVRDRRSLGGTKTCRVHVVYRCFCVAVAHDHEFCHVISKLHANSFPRGIRRQPRLCFHNNIILGFKQVRVMLVSVVSSKRSVLCYGPRHQYPVEADFRPFKLLRVLDSLALRFYEFPDQVLCLVRLRYLAITYDGEIPKSISKLRNLQVFIVRRHRVVKSAYAPVSYLPMEIWYLDKLRHLQCTGYDLLDPSSIGLDGSFLLENLVTLSGVSAHSCTRGVLARMPKLAKVGIRIEPAPSTSEIFNPFGDFEQLYDDFESFKCVFVRPGLASHVIPLVTPSFPINITKITLSGCGFPWEYMSVIARLPNLQVLKLRCYAFSGPVCVLNESGFSRLRFLLLEDMDIKCLVADRYGCLQALECLIIRHCYKLEDINLDERVPHEMLEVQGCSPTTEAWARKVLGTRSDQCRVHIHSSRNDDSKHKS